MSERAAKSLAYLRGENYIPPLFNKRRYKVRIYDPTNGDMVGWAVLKKKGRIVNVKDLRLQRGLE